MLSSKFATDREINTDDKRSNFIDYIRSIGGNNYIMPDQYKLEYDLIQTEIKVEYNHKK